jgi:hypothetical protein
LISSAGQFLFHNPPIATISEVLQLSGDCGNLGFLKQADARNGFCSTTHRLQQSEVLQPSWFSSAGQSLFHNSQIAMFNLPSRSWFFQQASFSSNSQIATNFF